MIRNDNNQDIVTAQVRKMKSKNFSDYMDISILMIVGVLIIAIICTFFVEFVFGTEINWAEISANTVSVSACTIAIYLLLRSYSMRKGRKTADWQDGSQRLKTLSKMILEGDKAKYIASYCRAWEKERLDYDREDILSPVGVSLQDFKNKYSKYSRKELKANCAELTAYQLNTVLQAKRIKRLKFDERYFYSGVRGGKRHRSPSSEITTRQLNRLANIRIIITTVLTLLLSTTLLWDVILNFSWEALIKCVVKIAIIIFFGVIGMMGGYTFVTVNEVDEMNAKSDEIEVFLKWCDGNKDREKDGQKTVQASSTI